MVCELVPRNERHRPYTFKNRETERHDTTLHPFNNGRRVLFLNCDVTCRLRLTQFVLGETDDKMSFKLNVLTWPNSGLLHTGCHISIMDFN